MINFDYFSKFDPYKKLCTNNENTHHWKKLGTYCVLIYYENTIILLCMLRTREETNQQTERSTQTDELQVLQMSICRERYTT